MSTSWESELAKFLSDLSAVQDRTLKALTRKRECLVAADTEGLAAVNQQEDEIVNDLQDCLRKRQDLLRRAGEEGLPANSIRSLAGVLPRQAKNGLTKQVNEAGLRVRLLQHQSLVNWVLVQRTMIHLSQMLEIIATGGRLQPTYGKEESAHTSGALVNQEV